MNHSLINFFETKTFWEEPNIRHQVLPNATITSYLRGSYDKVMRKIWYIALGCTPIEIFQNVLQNVLETSKL